MPPPVYDCLRSTVHDSPYNPRFARQRRLDFWDDTAQANLASAHALIVGIGALGCPCADLLARAGVGKLTLIDRDLVDITNLHRQTLYTDADARAQRPKALAAAERLAGVNPEVEIHPLVADFNSADAEHVLLRERLGKPDILIDGCDNFETRYILNDLSVKHAIPSVYAGAVGTKRMATVFLPERGGERVALKIVHGRYAEDAVFRQMLFEEARVAVVENCERHGKLEIPELRDRLGTTRKFLIPLLEYFDAAGVTLRQGGHRVLKKR